MKINAEGTKDLPKRAKDIARENLSKKADEAYVKEPQTAYIDEPIPRADIRDNPIFFHADGVPVWDGLGDGFFGDPEDVVLQPGTKLGRYGPPRGKYTAFAGTPFEKLSLPWEESSMDSQKHEYIVKKPIEGIKQGEIAVAFCPGIENGSLGTGAMQQMFPNPIQYYIDNGYLEEV